MKEDILEYHPNGNVKRKIVFYPNGCKYYEQYYDQKGKYHREAQLPDYQSWHQNGYLYHQTFYIHGHQHNICNPAEIWLTQNRKIDIKFYHINDNFYNKLNWMNCIKNIYDE